MGIRVRTRLDFASALRDVADLARCLVADTGVSLPVGERIAKVRRLRILALRALDGAVMAELADGRSWEDIAAALGLPTAAITAWYRKGGCAVLRQLAHERADEPKPFPTYDVSLADRDDAAGI